MSQGRCFIGLLLALLCASLAMAGPAPRPALAADRPLLVQADEVVYDETLGTMTARGGVEINQDGRTLLADTVTYNERVDQVTASGNVVIMEKNGNVFFADFIELRDEFKNGLIAGFRLLFTDNARVAGNYAIRNDGNRTTVANAVYSPCDLCKDDPSRPPLWQIRAVRVIHNEEAQHIDFKDMFLEIFGIPVAYLPFFRVPDPTVERQSGLLPPGFGLDNRLGFQITLPYYYVIAPNIDLTLSPTVTTKEGPILAGEYRHRTGNGNFAFDGSITRPEKRNDDNERIGGRETRGHIRGEGRFINSPVWRSGFDLFLASDDTYLRRYGISKLDTLTNTAYLEGFSGRSYALATGYYFQGLRQIDRRGRSPLVLPLLDYSFVGEPQGAFGYPKVDASLLSIQRSEGVDTRRLSTTIGWHVPYVSPIGDIYSVTAQLRGDFYWVNDGVDPEGRPSPSSSGTEHRLKPLFALDWRYPFARSFGPVQHVIEPIVSFVATPKGGNPRRIPNEDSRNFEFDDTNLFAINRFPGLDRYEGGMRVAYGVKTSFHEPSGAYTEFLFGQSHRFDDSGGRAFPGDTGLEQSRSDYIARAVISPTSYIDIFDRMRLDQDDFTIRRHEVGALVGPSFLKLGATYAKIDREGTTSRLGDREQLTLNGYAQVSRFWRISADWRRDLQQDRTLGYDIALRYLDECFEMLFVFGRSNTRDREIEPSYEFGLRFRLKNLG
ncbi:MAG: LPS-assembly protein LptD [Alphaproteobacteria bacterium]|nr:LPS-assembly protein LptD [Alphaproteobacteria bacterium]